MLSTQWPPPIDAPLEHVANLNLGRVASTTESEVYTTTGYRLARSTFGQGWRVDPKPNKHVSQTDVQDIHREGGS